MGLKTSKATSYGFREVAGQPYDEVVTALAPYVGDFDRPLGSSALHGASLPPWMRGISPRISPVQTLADSRQWRMRFWAQRIPALESTLTSAGWHRQKAYTENIQNSCGTGLAKSAILLALWGERGAYAAGNTSHRASEIIAALLNNADGERWWSLNEDFRLLARHHPMHSCPQLKTASTKKTRQFDRCLSLTPIQCSR